MGGIDVVLTHGEIVCASAVGAARELEALRLGMTDPRAIHDGVKFGHWSNHIEGACAELAVCKTINVCWTASVNTNKREADIPPVLEVRLRTPPRRRDEEPCLIVRDNDYNSRYFVLVVGVCPNYEILGGDKGELLKRDEWRRDPNGWGMAYFVPASALRQFVPSRWRTICNGGEQ